MSGFYLMHRDWQDNPLFGREAYSRRDAWIWMIERACYTPKDIDISGKTVTLQRGQFSSSLRYMAKAWGWDEAKVRRFLSRARSENMIDAATDAGQTIVTICNYDRYQAPERTADAPANAAAPQQRRGGDANIKEGNKGKEDNPPNPPSEGQAKGKSLLPEDWVLPSVSDLPPKAKACAEQWTPASYATHGEAFGSYWRARRGMMADWRLTWANRIVTLHGQVMRDQKFGNAAPSAPSTGKPALSADEYRAFCLRNAETMEATGKTLDAEEWRKKAGVRVDRPPGNPRPIGDLVSNVMQRVA